MYFVESGMASIRIRNQVIIQDYNVFYRGGMFSILYTMSSVFIIVTLSLFEYLEERSRGKDSSVLSCFFFLVTQSHKILKIYPRRWILEGPDRRTFEKHKLYSVCMIVYALKK